MFSKDQKVDSILWCGEYRSPKKVQIMYHAKYGKNSKAPSRYNLVQWMNTFRETGSCEKKTRRRKTVDHQRIVEELVANPKQSLRRAANNVGVSVTSVRSSIKIAGMRRWTPKIVQELKETDYELRKGFASWVLRMKSNLPEFTKNIVFSDEAVFHLEGGINVHNCSHWCGERWVTMASLVPFSLMAMSMDLHSYLEMISNQFYPEFSALENSSELYLMQDGRPQTGIRRYEIG